MSREITKKFNKGDKFGDLIFIEEDTHELEVTGRQRHRKAVIQCFCGRRFITNLFAVYSGKRQSCGCKRTNNLIVKSIKHGKSNSSEYASWEAMKSRCLNPNNLLYCNYGGRGIKVCDRWLDFMNFYLDMGDKPDKSYSLERIDVNGNYEPKNCKWATRKEQDRNRTNTIKIKYNDEEWVLSDLANKFKMHHQTLKQRIMNGMNIEEAISKPIKYTKKV